MRIVLIVNPSASSTTPKSRTRVQDVLGRLHDLEVVATTHRDHATELAREAAADGVDVVAVLAGDGTLNEAANGLVGSDTAPVPLPGGSTNVFARSIGIGNVLDRATEQVLDALDRGAIRRIGVGTANGRHFLFHLGAGFDAAVISVVEDLAGKRPWLKRRLAHPVFAATTLWTFARRYDRRHPTYRVEIPGEPESEPGFYAIVSNTTPYAYFGPRPLRVTPHAGLDRPLALTVFRRLDAGVLAPATLSSMRARAAVYEHPSIVQRADLRELGFVSEVPFPWQVDGDFLGHSQRLDIRYTPDALSLVVP